MSRNRIIVSSGLGLVLTIAAAHAGPAGFVGKWQWSATKSTVTPGEPLPKSIVLDIAETSGSRIKWTLTAVDPSGESHTQNFDGPSNGAPTKVTGADDQTTASFTLA